MLQIFFIKNAKKMQILLKKVKKTTKSGHFIMIK